MLPPLSGPPTPPPPPTSKGEGLGLACWTKQCVPHKRTGSFLKVLLPRPLPGESGFHRWDGGGCEWDLAHAASEILNNSTDIYRALNPVPYSVLVSGEAEMNGPWDIWNGEIPSAGR